MGLLSKRGTVVMKEDSSALRRIEELEQLLDKAPASTKLRIESDLRALKAGVVGEKRIMYELKNSHLDMVVLQDLFLEHNGLTAQIDFLVLTQRRNFIIECKNLYGNIEINRRGDFIRTFDGKKREGIYSPVTQVRRHANLIHAMKRDSRDFLTNLLVDGNFDDLYRCLVVLANPKSILDDRFASQSIKRMVVKADSLVATIKAMNREKGEGKAKGLWSVTLKNAEWFLERHTDNPIDYTAQYCAADPAASNVSVVASSSGASNAPGFPDGSADTPACPRCGAPMVLRTAKRGARVGKQFYGCSTYPSCNGIINKD